MRCSLSACLFFFVHFCSKIIIRTRRRRIIRHHHGVPWPTPEMNWNIPIDAIRSNKKQTFESKALKNASCTNSKIPQQEQQKPGRRNNGQTPAIGLIVTAYFISAIINFLIPMMMRSQRVLKWKPSSLPPPACLGDGDLLCSHTHTHSHNFWTVVFSVLFVPTMNSSPPLV